MPYSNNWGFRPRYGNRYLNYPSTYMGQQQQQPSHGAVLNPVDPNQQAIPQVQAPPQPTFSANEDLAQRDEARDQQRVGQAQAYGYTPQQKSAGDLALGALGLLSPIPGVGTLANTLSQSLQGDDAGKAVQSSNTQGYLGQHDTQGNVYGQDGVGYDPLTGQATNSFGSVGSAWDANQNFASNFFTPAEERDDYISPAARNLGVTAASQAGIMNDVGERSIETLLNQAGQSDSIDAWNQSRGQRISSQPQSAVEQLEEQIGVPLVSSGIRSQSNNPWANTQYTPVGLPVAMQSARGGLQRSIGSFGDWNMSKAPAQPALSTEDLGKVENAAARQSIEAAQGSPLDFGDHISSSGNVFEIQGANDYETGHGGDAYAGAITDNRGTTLASGHLVQDDKGTVLGSTTPGTRAHQQREESSSEPGGK